MKTHKIIAVLIPIMGLLAFPSCSDESTEHAPTDHSAIRFAAQSPALNRSATTTENISEFTVYAYTEGQPFMQNVPVTKSAADNTWSYSPAVYWPATPVNFYAFSPSRWSDYETGTPANPSADAPTFNPSTPVDYYGEYGNTDLIYAVNMQQIQSASPVVFNFRHALSQVLVNLRTDNSDVLDIEVSNVTVNGVKTSGSFTFPTVSTTAGGTARGKWSNETGSSQYIYFMPSTQDEMLTLTATAQEANNVSQGFLLPQTLGTFTLENTSVSGDYISVDCIIYNKDSEKQVWPNDNTPAIQNINDGGHKTGRLYFPLVTDNVTEWQEGVRYIYTITINEPAGLQEIIFGAPSVDTYTEVTVSE